MSIDPIQDLFDREIPRSASPSTTRATLDDLTPGFERARSRRRARVGAIAAFAVLGSTGGAAALGVGPVALGHRPATESNNGLAGGNETEAPPETADPSVTTTTVTTTVPTTIFPVVTVTTTIPDPTDPVGPSGSSATVVGEDPEGSDDPNESGSDSRGSDDPADHDSSKGSDDDPDDDNDPADDPVPGPLTASTDDGTVTVGIGDNGLTLIDVTPDPGVSYRIETKPNKISVEFHDTRSGDELSTLKFKLVTGGATVQGDAVDGITVKVDDSPS